MLSKYIFKSRYPSLIYLRQDQAFLFAEEQKTQTLYAALWSLILVKLRVSNLSYSISKLFSFVVLTTTANLTLLKILFWLIFLSKELSKPSLAMIRTDESPSILSIALTDSSSWSALDTARSITSWSVSPAAYKIVHTYILLLETQPSHIHQCQFLEATVKVLLLLLLQKWELLLLPA